MQNQTSGNAKKKIVVLDVETDPFKAGRSPKPFLAGYYDGKTIRLWWGKNCIADCWKALRKEHKGARIYWHNGGKFDARYFLQHLKDAKTAIHRIKSRMAKFVLPDGTEFVDSFCLLPVSLKATGEKLDIDYRKMEANVRNKHREEIIRYWKQDLRVLFDKVSEFVEEYGHGLTMAGRTFDVLKKRFGFNPPRTNEHYDAKMREFYYGGRVEFFALGHVPGNCLMLDINSAYPYAMTQKHATGTEFRSASRLPKGDKLGPCFVSFTGSAKGLPWKDDNGALFFTRHEGTFHVTGWELAYALEAGAVEIRELHQCLVPTETKDFSAFVDYFYRMKSLAPKDSSERLFAKLFLNSAYGRFALNPREFRDTVITHYRQEPPENEELYAGVERLTKIRHPELKGKKYREQVESYWENFQGKYTLANDFEDIGASIWERPTEIRSNAFFNVATAASITGWVRAYLARALASVDGAIYCDTDSILCRSANSLQLGEALGQWKVEGVGTECWIGGRKLYAVRLQSGKFKTASKGVKLTPEEIIRVAEGEAVTSTLAAPTFSPLTTRCALGSEKDFITRTVRRDDLRKRRK